MSANSYSFTNLTFNHDLVKYKKQTLENEINSTVEHLTIYKRSGNPSVYCAHDLGGTNALGVKFTATYEALNLTIPYIGRGETYLYLY